MLDPIAYAPHADPDQFIRDVTDRIWVSRDIGHIAENYEPDSIVHGPLGTAIGVDQVLQGSMMRIAETPSHVGQAEDVIARRMKNALGELTQAAHFDYHIVNDDLEEAADELRAVYVAGRARALCRPGLLPGDMSGVGVGNVALLRRDKGVQNGRVCRGVGGIVKVNHAEASL